MPQAKDAKQHCIWNRAERALCFQDFVFPGNVQVTWVTLSICKLGLHTNEKYACLYIVSVLLRCCALSSALAQRQNAS